MRDILFRGKMKGTGKWVSGRNILQAQNEGGVFIVPTGHPIALLRYVESGPVAMMIPFCEVDPETIGQFTGLTDKNGKKIFEGDILAGSWNTKTVIYFDELYLQFRAREISSYARENAIDYYDNGKLEIIGNIHDNPELLGGAEDGK